MQAILISLGVENVPVLKCKRTSTRPPAYLSFLETNLLTVKNLPKWALAVPHLINSSFQFVVVPWFNILLMITANPLYYCTEQTQPCTQPLYPALYTNYWHKPYAGLMAFFTGFNTLANMTSIGTLTMYWFVAVAHIFRRYCPDFETLETSGGRHLNIKFRPDPFKNILSNFQKTCLLYFYLVMLTLAPIGKKCKKKFKCEHLNSLEWKHVDQWHCLFNVANRQGILFKSLDFLAEQLFDFQGLAGNGLAQPNIELWQKMPVLICVFMALVCCAANYCIVAVWIFLVCQILFQMTYSAS